MRRGVQHFVQNTLEGYPAIGGRVLEVGSLNVNGTVRQFFSNFSFYIGLDMRRGRNVQLVAKADNIPFDNETFDCVVCCDTLEHDDRFWISIDEMRRVLKPGGLFMLTVPGIGFGKHSHPSDYWRFTKEAIELLMAGMKEINVVEEKMAVLGSSVK